MRTYVLACDTNTNYLARACFDVLVSVGIISLFVCATAFNGCIKVGFPVELSTTNYLQIGCHMNTLFRRQVVSYLGSGVLFSTKGPSECILTYAHLKWT
jgi:hypothetical protein